ncbi:MAG: FIST N-terminal domain-containing protein [Gemmobacter sp.]|nr:FIST N-terminal domain-containing protein [Gemmobacter sp.]
MPRAQCRGARSRCVAKTGARSGPGAFCVVISCSSRPRRIWRRWRRACQGRFQVLPVIGCTTAGEISPEGYAEGEIVAVALPRGQLCRAICAGDRPGGHGPRKS